MLFGLSVTTATSRPFLTLNQNPSIHIPNNSMLSIGKFDFLSSPIKNSASSRKPIRFIVYAGEGNGNNRDGNDLETDGKERDKGENGFKEMSQKIKNGGEDEELKKGGGGNGRPRFSFKWVDLLLDPDPDNILAIGLTGLLSWASVQVLWQLFFITLAILVAALKYSFIAALLIFILIALL